MLELKKYYKIDFSDKSEQKGAVTVEQDSTEILIEIDRFNKNKLLQKEVKKKFKENMSKEYELIQIYQPDLILKENA